MVGCQHGRNRSRYADPFQSAASALLNKPIILPANRLLRSAGIREVEGLMSDR